jgi:hypothetical protein
VDDFALNFQGLDVVLSAGQSFLPAKYEKNSTDDEYANTFSDPLV